MGARSPERTSVCVSEVCYKIRESYLLYSVSTEDTTLPRPWGKRSGLTHLSITRFLNSHAEQSHRQEPTVLSRTGWQPAQTEPVTKICMRLKAKALRDASTVCILYVPHTCGS